MTKNILNNNHAEQSSETVLIYVVVDRTYESLVLKVVCMRFVCNIAGTLTGATMMRLCLI